MAFAHLSLLALGGALAAIPVILHLTMRRKPKSTPFPAVRFLVPKSQTNQRSLQLRHWLLLALRILVLALAAFAFARPSVASAVYGDWMLAGVLGVGVLIMAALLVGAIFQQRGALIITAFTVVLVLLFGAGLHRVVLAMQKGPKMLLSDSLAPVSAVFIFDDSPRMLLKSGNKTRLQAAQELATELLGQLPPDSEAAILSTRVQDHGARTRTVAGFVPDLALAARQVKSIECRPQSASPFELIQEGLALLQESKKERKEIYIFTDLTAPSWPPDSAARIRAEADKAEQVGFFVIDVGLEKATNVAVENLTLSSETPASGADLTVEVDVRNQGPAAEHRLRLEIEERDPRRWPILQDGKVVVPPSAIRGQQSLEIPENSIRQARFQLVGMPPGVYHGRVRLEQSDALSIDDEATFSFQVRPLDPFLIAASPDVVASFLDDAVSLRYTATIIPPEQLDSVDLSAYSSVCLLDPPPLSEITWKKLASYVEAGGGLAVFLGRHAEGEAGKLDPRFVTPTAEKLLPSLPTRVARAPGDLFPSPDSYEHAILRPLRPVSTSVPWDRMPIYFFWLLTPPAEGASIILRTSDGEPLYLERRIAGANAQPGLVLLMATPISDPLSPKGRPTWNELPTGEDAWPFVVLMNESLDYLASARRDKLNFLPGSIVTLPNDETLYPDRYQLFSPRGSVTEILARNGAVTISATNELGIFRLKGARGGPMTRGFSVRLPAGATDLTRCPPSQLEESFGKDRYQVARNVSEIEHSLTSARRGRDFYPMLISLLAIVFAMENLLANRFYKGATR